MRVPHHRVRPPVRVLHGHRGARAHVQQRLGLRLLEHPVHQTRPEGHVPGARLRREVIRVHGLVDVPLALQAADQTLRRRRVDDFDVRVHSRGEVDGRLRVRRVTHAELNLELVPPQRHLVRRLEPDVPHLPRVVVVLELEHHGRFRVIGVGIGARGAHHPVHVPGKAVLLHRAGAELGEAEGDAAGDGLGLVPHGVGADEEDLVAARLAPGNGQSREVTRR